MAAKPRPSAKKRADDQRQASRLVRRLMAHVMFDITATVANPDPGKPHKKSPYMDDSQVRAALGLLKKFLPDLKSIELSTDSDQPLVYEVRRTFVHVDRPTEPGDIPATDEPE